MSIKRKIILTLAIFAAIGAALVYFLTLPLFSQIKKESLNLVLQINKSYELENRIKSLDDYETSRRKYREYSERIAALFINTEEPVGFIEFLEKEAKASDLSIEITPLASSQFQILVRGRASNLIKYIARLEAAPYLFEIANLNIGKQTASFLIKAYSK